MVYLDYNATTPLKPAVRASMMESMERYGNPSSVHRFGQIARRAVEESRAAVAALVGVKPAQVVFTSGGTEANNMVFHALGDKPFITSPLEHASVLACAPNATFFPVNQDGVVDLDAAATLLTSAPSLVSLMMVNNETGVIQPVTEMAQMAKKAGHLIHTDAVQAAGKLPLDFKNMGVDFLTLSAHKIGGPQGMGALILGENTSLPPLLKGGGQEMNRRAGTENVAAIVGFGVAAQLAADDLHNVPRLTLLRDQLQKSLQAIAGDNALVVGEKAPRVATTLNIIMRGVSHETQTVAMDLAGIAVSAGSACSSGKVKTSHVLRAMGLDDNLAGSALRFSLGWNTSSDDIDRGLIAWRDLYLRTHPSNPTHAA